MMAPDTGKQAPLLAIAHNPSTNAQQSPSQFACEGATDIPTQKAGHTPPALAAPPSTYCKTVYLSATSDPSSDDG